MQWMFRGRLFNWGVLAVVLICLTAWSRSIVTRQDCEQVDWLELGFVDGFEGRADSHLGRHKRICGQHRIEVDARSYAQGFGQGRGYYCGGINYFSLGFNGKSFQPLCESAEYRALYQAGLARYCGGRDAFELGLSGEPYAGGCSDGFSRDYSDGRDVRQLESDRLVLKGELGERHRQLDSASGSVEMSALILNIQNLSRRIELVEFEIALKTDVHEYRESEHQLLLDLW